MSIPTAGARLRHAWKDEPLVVPGVFCPLVAQLAERAGFRAIYLSGGALSAGQGVPDIGLLTLTEFTQAARGITSAVSLPLLCDADTGFGEVLNVERTVREFEQAGAAGIHLEDQVLPKRCGHLTGKSLVPTEVMQGKIRAACAARNDSDFVIIARTDARSVEGFDGALRRAQAYVEAGADAIFPEALETEAEFAEFGRQLSVPLLANMTEYGRSPSLDVQTLGAMGYKMILYPLTAFRVAMKAAEAALSILKKDGHQRALLSEMMTRAELYDVLKYTGYEERDRSYFGGDPR